MNTSIKILARCIVRPSMVLAMLLAWWLATAPSAQAASGANYTTIQAAVNDSGCTTINVAAGTYYENLTIKRSVAINGATTGSTIVDGNNRDIVIQISNAVTVNFSRLTFQHGNTGDQQAAGGITVHDYSTVNLATSTVRDNQGIKR